MSDTLPVAYPRVYDGAIARFADSGLQQSISAALAGLEPAARGAVVAFTDGHEAKLAVVARRGSHWSAVGVLEHPLGDGKWTGQAAVRYSW